MKRRVQEDLAAVDDLEVAEPAGATLRAPGWSLPSTSARMTCTAA
jgi:hypothetical protein